MEIRGKLRWVAIRMTHQTDYLDIFLKRTLDPSTKITCEASFEARRIAAFLSERRWTDLSMKILDEYPGDPSAIPSFLEAEAFRYFFPAFMKCARDEHDKADVISDVVIHKLWRAATGDSPYLAEVIDQYETAEKRAIALFLDDMSKKYCSHYPHDEAKEALERGFLPFYPSL